MGELIQIKTIATNLLTTRFIESAYVKEFDCDICGDVGFTFEEQEIGGHRYSGAIPCGCVLKKERERKLGKIPPEFQNISLKDLVADSRRHPKQSEYISALKSNSSKNFFLSGKPGTGKSLFMWLLYQEAVEADKRTYICTLTGLLDGYKAFFNDQSVYPYLTAARLREGVKHSIFIDDIDKARPTEYAAEQFFELINAVYEFQHHLVVTTNLRLQDLIRHFEKADERYGEAICRRLISNAQIVEMF